MSEGMETCATSHFPSAKSVELAFQPFKFSVNSERVIVRDTHIYHEQIVHSFQEPMILEASFPTPTYRYDYFCPSVPARQSSYPLFYSL